MTCPKRLPHACGRARFGVPERGLAVRPDDLFRRPALVSLHLVVEIEKRPPDPCRRQPAHGRFAAAGHADEDEVLPRLRDRTHGRRLPRRVDRGAGEQLRRALALRHEHRQPAGARDPQPLRLKQQCGAQRVEHHVQHAVAGRKASQLDGGNAIFGIHPHRRRVDDHARVPMQPVRRVIVDHAVLPGPVAGHGPHLAGPPVARHGDRRAVCPAAAEHERLFPGK